jgi:hypothetical protein
MCHESVHEIATLIKSKDSISFPEKIFYAENILTKHPRICLFLRWCIAADRHDGINCRGRGRNLGPFMAISDRGL